jgi:hypothetical protein
MHYAKSYTQTYWCFDRATNDFRWVQWSPSAGVNGVVGSVRDISIHRFDTAMPTNMVVSVVRNSVLRRASQSVLDRSAAVTLNSHNLVSLVGVSPRYFGATMTLAHESWGSWFSGTVRPPSVDWLYDASWLADEITVPAGALHTTHVRDSGHGVFWWLNGRLVLMGTWTYATGGPNVFVSDHVIDSINAVISADSGGAESLRELSLEDLQ